MPNDDTITTWELDAAVDPAFRLFNRDHVSGILQDVNEGAPYTVRWRAQTVQDQRRTSRREISAELERLWRWSRLHPRDIFRTGFHPRMNVLLAFGFALGSRPRAETNLRSYVASNTSSVFVSTTRTRWAPRSRGNFFRYDIFAPGGIDVNPTLGQHAFENQNEIAFVGGIRTEFIYGAVEFGPHGRQIRYHENSLYRGPPRPLASRGDRCSLPTLLHNLTPASQQANYCEAIRPTSQKRSFSNHELMRSPGLILEPRSDCSYWYKVNIKYLNFDQPAEIGQIEPYGFIEVYTIGSVIYQESYVFRLYPKYDAPSVPKGENLYSKAKCLVVQSHRNSDTVRVCFDGNVHEYDSSSGDDEIAVFSLKCIDTSPNTNPSELYHMTAKGKDGSLKWAFNISPCDENCLKNNLPDDEINGVC